MIHIDTHVFEALYKGEPRRIAGRARTLIGGQPIRLSPAVLFELPFIARKTGIEDVVAAVAEFGSVYDVSISPTRFDRVVEAAAALTWAREPFDRLIVANAIADGARLVTKDELIRANFPDAVW